MKESKRQELVHRIMVLETENENLRRIVEQQDTLLEEARMALRIVSSGIWRDAERNACGLSGAAVAVHSVENALEKIEGNGGV